MTQQGKGKKGKNARKKTAAKATVKTVAGSVKRRPAAKLLGQHLSPCSLEYAESLANPFTGPIACIPSFPALPTGKMKCFVRETISINAGGGGFLCYNPWKMAFSGWTNAGEGTRPPLTLTPAAYAAGVVPAFGVAGLLLREANTPYVRSDNVEVRLISAGLRARYIGTKLNQGGRIFGLHHPDHDTLVGMTQAQLAGFDECSVDSVTTNNKWFTLLYRPVDYNDFEFKSAGELEVDETETPMVIGMIPPTGLGSEFEYEAYANFEVLGAIVRQKTASFSDATGLSAVTNALSLNTGIQRPFWGSDGTLVRALQNSALHLLNEFSSGAGGEYSRALGAALIHNIMGRKAIKA